MGTNLSPDRARIESRRIGTEVPAREGAVSLPACLTASAWAAQEAAIPVHLVVVPDACTTSSADAFAAHRAALMSALPQARAETIDITEPRAAGAQDLFDRHSSQQSRLPDSTDPSGQPRWLTRQLAYAQLGADSAAGTDAVTDWGDRPAAVIVQSPIDSLSYWVQGAGPQTVDHGHELAANLGVSATAYVAASGFPRVRVRNERALFGATRARGRKIFWVDDIAVTTCAGPCSRTPGGLAGDVKALEHPLVGRAPTSFAGDPATEQCKAIVLTAASPTTPAQSPLTLTIAASAR